MLKESYPYYLGNKPEAPNQDLIVTDKYTNEVATRVAIADEQAIDLAIQKSVDATDAMRELPSYKKQEILLHCVDRFVERAEELAASLCIEAGKPIKDRGEKSAASLIPFVLHLRKR